MMMSQVQINIEQRSLQFLIRKRRKLNKVSKVPNVETNNENLDDLKEENEEPMLKLMNLHKKKTIMLLLLKNPFNK